MAVPAEFVHYCAELLSVAGEVRTKRMFGGWGVYVDDVFIAIVFGETLHLKADGQTESNFAGAGYRRFEYTARGSLHPMSYWSVPAEAMDSPQLMAPWARLAIGAALRAAAAITTRRSSSRAARDSPQVGALARSARKR